MGGMGWGMMGGVQTFYHAVHHLRCDCCGGGGMRRWNLLTLWQEEV